MFICKGLAMRIQLASDLHLEHLHARFPDFRGVEATDADVLVLAGDIAKGGQALELFADWPCPVVFVPGNHEFYDATPTAVLAEFAARAAAVPHLHVLAPGVWEHAGVRFIGCTLWSDYAVFGVARRAEAMAVCAEEILDHRAIRGEDGAAFLPADALALHRTQRAWLSERLAEPFAGRTVVVSHHAPHPRSIHPRYADALSTAAFVSDLAECLGLADLHLHGHTHDSFDYRVGRTRVVANPLGYCRGSRTAATPAGLQRENPLFDSRLILTL